MSEKTYIRAISTQQLMTLFNGSVQCSVRNTPTLLLFKSRLKTHLFKCSFQTSQTSQTSSSLVFCSQHTDHGICHLCFYFDMYSSSLILMFITMLKVYSVCLLYGVNVGALSDLRSQNCAFKMQIIIIIIIIIIITRIISSILCGTLYYM